MRSYRFAVQITQPLFLVVRFTFTPRPKGEAPPAQGPTLTHLSHLPQAPTRLALPDVAASVPGAGGRAP